MRRTVGTNISKKSYIPPRRNVNTSVENKFTFSYLHPEVNKDRELKKSILQGRETNLPFTVNALKMLVKRYIRTDHDGKVLESPEEMFFRVADTLANVEKQYGASDDQILKYRNQFYEVMSSFKFTPGGRTIANAGWKRIVANCIVLHPEDNMESIFNTLRDAALLQQAGSGLGFPFHLLRPAGSIAKASHGISSGPISFLNVYNSAFGIIKQQGRHGANMAIMNIDHPDFPEFLKCKEKEGDIANFNISVGLTDEFMRQVRDDVKKPWICSFNGVKMLPREITRDSRFAFKSAKPIERTAREWFMELVKNSWKNGEPGVVFPDTVNNTNPLPGLGRIEGCNPCITEDMWINTTEGPRQVKDLIGTKFTIRDPTTGDLCNSTEKGFFSKGKKRVYKLETKEGFTLELTKDHKLWTSEGWKKAKDLTEKDNIILDTHPVEEWDGDGSEDEGYILGLIMGDGHIKNDGTAFICLWDKDNSIKEIKDEVDRILPDILEKVPKWMYIEDRKEYRLGSKPLTKLCERFGLTNENKNPGDLIEKASSDFYKGFLRGFFDTDGTVGTNFKTGVSVRLNQSNKTCLQVIQRMLLRLGIYSRLYLRRKADKKLMPDGKGGEKLYDRKDNYEIIISCDSIAKYKQQVGFIRKHKKENLNYIINNRRFTKSKFICHLVTLTRDKKREVFDCTIKHQNHAYDAQGVVISNCGEEWLHDGDVCNLGNINLEPFVTKDRKINKSELVRVSRIATRMLDNVVDISDFPTDRVNVKAKGNRRIGLGIMGFGDMLYKMRIGYNTQQGRYIAYKVMSIIQEASEYESSLLAETKGVFPNWDKSVFYPKIKRRNSALTNIAPTGTTSLMFDISSGMEPYYALAYHYKNVLGGDVQLTYVNKHLEVALKEANCYNEELLKDIVLKGTLQHRKELPEWIRTTFVTSMDISATDHVLMQAEFQKKIDNSISKTINFRKEATLQDIYDGYILAWENGCKGCTVYRDGSRNEQVLNLNISASKKEKKKNMCVDCNVELIKREGCMECPSCGYSKCSL